MKLGQKNNFLTVEEEKKTVIHGYTPKSSIYFVRGVQSEQGLMSRLQGPVPQENKFSSLFSSPRATEGNKFDVVELDASDLGLISYL